MNATSLIRMLEVSASRWKQSDQASDLDSIERKIAQFIRVFDFNDEKSVKILFYILSKTEFNNYSYEFINGATSLIRLWGAGGKVVLSQTSQGRGLG